MHITELNIPSIAKLLRNALTITNINNRFADASHFVFNIFYCYPQ